jgi:hypothetical protein
MSTGGFLRRGREDKRLFALFDLVCLAALAVYLLAIWEPIVIRRTEMDIPI